MKIQRFPSVLGALALIAAAAFASPAQTPAPAAPPAAAAQATPTLDLRGDIDVGLRWLRYAQDKDTGSYGGSVETTALVLRAMIQSPRKYQRVDGPFVQRALDFLVSRQDADGSIHDAGASREAIARQTRVATAALLLHAHVSTEAAVQKALRFVVRTPRIPRPCGTTRRSPPRARS